MTRLHRAPGDRAARRAAHQGGLPDPVADGARRAAAGLPRQRRHHPEAAAGARRRARLLRAVQRRGAPRRAPAVGGGHRGLRGRPRDGGGVRRGQARRPRVHQERDRGPEPRGLRVQQRHGQGPRRLAAARRRRTFRPRPRRRRRRHRDGAPREPRPLAGAVRQDRRDPALDRPHRRGPAGPHPARRRRDAADPGAGRGPPVERPGHDQPGRRAGPAGARGRRAVRAGRLPVGAAPAVRRRRDRCRLGRLERPQDARAPGDRLPLGPARRPRRHAAVPDRRFDDRGGADGGLDVRGTAAAVRGRRPDGGAGDRPGGGGRLPERRRDGPGRRARAAAHPLRPRVAADGPRGADRRSRRRRRPGRHDRVHRRRHPPARRRPGPRRPRGRGAGGPPLRVAGGPPVQGAAPPPGRRSTSTTTPPRSTRSWPVSRRRARSSGCPDAARVDVPGDHPGPLPPPAREGPAGAVRRRGPPREPDVRGRGHAAGAARRDRRRRRREGRVLRGAGLLDLAGEHERHARPGGRPPGVGGAARGRRSSCA